MKSINYLFFVTLLIFCSCSSEEGLQEDNNESLLKSYTLTKDTEGKYSISYDLKENTTVSLFKDIEKNVNEAQLFSGNVAVENKQDQSLSLEDDLLQLDILEGGEITKSMYIEDASYNEFLESYSVTDLGDDNYQLGFKVKDGTAVSYEYNEETLAYEIHLKVGEAKGVEFAKTYIKTEDVLKINFVNYTNLYSSKSDLATEPITRPKVVYL